MSIFKRALSMAMALAMVFAMVPTAFAAGTPEISMGTATVDVSGGAATVQVPVMIANNPGFGGMDISISIPDGWSITEIKTDFLDFDNYTIFCNVMSMGGMSIPMPFVTPTVNPNSSGVGKLVAAIGTGDITTSGNICWVTYSVPAGIENGDYAVSVTPVKINTGANTAANIAGDFTFTPGTITVTGGAAPHVHSYVAGEYTWAGDYSACTVVGTCECSDTVTATAVVTSKVEPNTCTEKATVYTATFAEAWAETQTKTVSETPSGHAFTTYVSDNNATCTADGTKTAVCDNGCGEKDTVADTGSMKAHVDNNTDHKCDYDCGKSDMGEHKDSNADTDHVCDYGCGEVLEVCADKADDGDHNCDVCGKADVSAHNYAGASCNDPATCTECGQTSGTAIGHSFTNYVYNNDATCENDGTETAQCDRACGVAPDTRVKVGSKLGHAWDAGTVTTPAKCEVDGVMTYTCGNDASHTKTEPITAIGHAWDAGTVTTPAKCDVPGVMTHVCGNDASHTKTEAITAPGHTWDAGTVTTPATCSVPGVKTYTCTVDAAHTKTEEIPTLEHTYGSNGKCTVCGAAKPTTNTGSSAVPSFDINVKDSANGEIEVKSDAKVGEMVVVTAVPDAGYVLEQLIVVDKNGDKIKTTKNADGTFTFKMPVGDVKIEASFAVDNRIFTDVNEGDYFFNAVQWAAENGITNGMTATTFVPNGVCNRAQVVTFLWRAAGCPAPKSNVMPFTDVAAGAYYYNAVLWAVENGITNGMSATEFAPNATVTRGQTVTFLWRAEKGGTVSGESKFVDVEAGAYYADAVQWAVANGITNGMSATEFAPMSGCTRGQIVTFLYRTFAK